MTLSTKSEILSSGRPII